MATAEVRLQSCGAVALALEVGQLIYERVYDCDPRRIAVGVASRRLREVTRGAPAPSAAALERSARVYALVRRLEDLAPGARLDLAHYRCVAELPPDEAAALLQQASLAGWTVVQLRRAAGLGPMSA